MNTDGQRSVGTLQLCQHTQKNGFYGKEREALIQSHERMKVQLHALYTSVLMQGGQLLKTEPAARYA